MREQSFSADEESAIKHQVPSPPSVRKSKRKMDRGRLGGRGLFKNPPQPHMCIKDVLVDSQEPCFINVLSWDKISTPAYPEDTIPLYGGIKIICNSMNSLVCTEFLKGIEPGKQPAIFAVVVNPQILKMSGKNAEEASRDSFIYLIEDFVENMNENVKFQHQFSVLVDRDVVGELKDIWFIIQSKREAERAELSSHGDGDRNLTVRQNAVPKPQKQPPQSQESIDDMSLQQMWKSLDQQEKQKAPVTHIHPHPNGSAKESSWLFSERERKVCLDKKITDFIPTYRKDQDELVWTSQLKYPPKVSGKKYNYTLTYLSKYSKSFWTEGNASKAAPPSFQESIDNKVRGFAQIRNTEKHSHKHVLPKREKSLPLPKPRGSNKLHQASAADPQVQYEYFETGKEEDAMFDIVRQVVATKILPSLDNLDNEYGEISSPYFALEEVNKKPYNGVTAVEDRAANFNSFQLTQLSDALSLEKKSPERRSTQSSESSPLCCAEIDDLIRENLTLASIKGGNSPPLEMLASNCKLILKQDDFDDNGYSQHTLQNSIDGEDLNGEIIVAIPKGVNKPYGTNAGNLPSSDELDQNNVQNLLNEVNKNDIGLPTGVKIHSFCADCCGEVDNKEDGINLDKTENLEVLSEMTTIPNNLNSEMFKNSKTKLSSEGVELSRKKISYSAEKSGIMVNRSGNSIVRRSKSFTDLNFSIQGSDVQRSVHLRDN